MVHHVPIATDVTTAAAYLRSWKSSIAKGKAPFEARRALETKTEPLEGLNTTHRVLALVAHDNKKLDLCCFAVEHAREIFREYNYVLATGTTGLWLQRFFRAAGHDNDAEKIRLCNSGPLGGDIQIAEACIKGLCQRVIFFQDPSVNHPHDSDIRLFEQAVLDGVSVELATSVESARLLLGV